MRRLIVGLLFAIPALAFAGTAPATPPPGENIETPKLLRKVKPVYPSEARAAGIRGEVVLEMIIDKSGSVRDVKVVRGLPKGLSRAAVDAVSQWKFKPGTLRGEPVDVVFSVTLNFKP